MNSILIYPRFRHMFWSFKYALEVAGKQSALPRLGLQTPIRAPALMRLSVVNCRARMGVFVVQALFLLALTTTTQSAQGQTDPEKWLKEAEAAYGTVTNYVAIFHKQQRVGGKLLQEETIRIKFRKPFSLYMKWIAEPNKGSELLYVEGWNEDRARVHKGRWLRFIVRNLAPEDPQLMKNNLRPFTDTGIGFLVKTVAVNVRKAIKAGELSFYERGEETVYGRKTQRLEVVFPKEKAEDYDACRLIINQDIESKILVRIRMYDWGDQLSENYGYEYLKLDAGLTDADFDPENAAYHF